VRRRRGRAWRRAQDSLALTRIRRVLRWRWRLSGERLEAEARRHRHAQPRKVSWGICGSGCPWCEGNRIRPEQREAAAWQAEVAEVLDEIAA